MPIFLGHRLVLVELVRFVQGSQPIGAGSGGGYALQLLQDSPELTRHARYRIPLRQRIAVKQVPLALARRTGRASQTVAMEGTVRWSRG